MSRLLKCTGVVALLLGLGASLQADETKGTIKSVDTSRKEVVLKGLVKDTVYEMTKDATVWLDGLRSKLGDLKADDKAAIIYTKSGDHLMASQIPACATLKKPAAPSTTWSATNAKSS